MTCCEPSEFEDLSSSSKFLSDETRLEASVFGLSWSLSESEPITFLIQTVIAVISAKATTMMVVTPPMIISTLSGSSAISLSRNPVVAVAVALAIMTAAVVLLAIMVVAVVAPAIVVVLVVVTVVAVDVMLVVVVWR